jgi:hypothetical protein
MFGGLSGLGTHVPSSILWDISVALHVLGHLALPRVFVHAVELLEVGNGLTTKPMLTPLLM